MLRRCLLAYITLALLALLASYLTDRAANRPVAGDSWTTARRDSAQLLADPRSIKDNALVAVFAAKTYGWRGHFAVHTWLVLSVVARPTIHATTLLVGATATSLGETMPSLMAIGTGHAHIFSSSIRERPPRQ